MGERYAGEMIDKKSLPKFEKKIDCPRTNPLESKKPMEELEVIGKGTKLMKSMNFPTVIVKLGDGDLGKARVYYVTLELDEGELMREIPAVMFSNPYVHKKTSVAELLPMALMRNSKAVFLTPILQRNRYRCFFRRGCTLKIKSLVVGREIYGSGECLWKRYDLTQRVIQDRIRKFVEMDIGQLSLRWLNTILPLKHRTNYNKRLRSIKNSSHRVRQSSGIFNLEKGELSKVTYDSLTSNFQQSSELIGLVSRGVNKCASFFETVPLKMYMNKDLKLDCGKTSLKDSFASVNELDKYWCISKHI